MSFDDALRAFAAIREREDADSALAPTGRSRLLVHRVPSPRAVVFLHGFTNAPEQFALLGQRFYDAGDAVVIPRLPYHGERDRLTRALVRLTLTDLQVTVLEAIALATQVGREVYVVGLSLGGLLTLWAGAHCELAGTVAIAPFLALGRFPPFVDRVMPRVLGLFPDRYLWWDPFEKADNPRTPPHAYPGFPLWALLPQFALRDEIWGKAQQGPPLARVSALLTNAGDHVVSNQAAFALFDRYRDHGATIVERRIDIPGSHHDIIDPWHRHLPLEWIYDTVFGLVPRTPDGGKGMPPGGLNSSREGD